ncbi:MAG: alanine:cation symporter family protein [Alphaproteobacteria bacterium]|nr:alanine:cation symporter family protein [Alphaproteobacteria bacterium]
MGIDKIIDDRFSPIADAISSVIFYSVPITDTLDVQLILVWLSGAAIFFTVFLGFINFRYFKHAIDVVRGKYDDPNEHSGEISRFQALATSLSGTVGLGNIAGVAVAVSVGGPGAVIWMIVMAFFSMSTKFAEVMLAVKYRRKRAPEDKHEVSGGPMYYLKEAFAHHNIPYVGSIMAVIFAICCIGGSLGGGNMFQANQAFGMLYSVTGGETGPLAGKGWLFGIGLAIMVGIVIIGGIKKIANVASKLVPAMGILYLAAGFIVIAIHYANIPAAFVTMFTEAFNPAAGFGGLLGVILVGVQRAAFSNEAGLGSAAIVHANANTKDAVSQGMVGMLGPFIDTVIICLVTALVIVISGTYENVDGMAGVELTSAALESGVSWFPYILAVAVFLFAYSTMITWSYYGVKAIGFLFGERPWVELAYKIFFCFCIVIGASTELDSIIMFTDAMIFSMGIPNIIGLFLLAGVIRREVKLYTAKLKAQKEAA